MPTKQEFDPASAKKTAQRIIGEVSKPFHLSWMFWWSRKLGCICSSCTGNSAEVMSALKAEFPKDSFWYNLD